MKAVAVLALFVVVVGAQVPPRCVTPSLWEGRLFEVSPQRRFERFARISYDASNQRTRILEEEQTGTEREAYDELFLHKSNVGYRLNLRTKQCEKFALTEPFRFIEVPVNATFYTEAYVGSSSIAGAGVLVDIFGGDTPRGRYAGSWTQTDCLPVTDSYVSSTTQSFTHWTFFDITLGISDPNVFVPPEQCR